MTLKKGILEKSWNKRKKRVYKSLVIASRLKIFHKKTVSITIYTNDSYIIFGIIYYIDMYNSGIILVHMAYNNNSNIVFVYNIIYIIYNWHKLPTNSLHFVVLQIYYKREHI